MKLSASSSSDPFALFPGRLPAIGSPLLVFFDESPKAYGGEMSESASVPGVTSILLLLSALTLIIVYWIVFELLPPLCR